MFNILLFNFGGTHSTSSYVFSFLLLFEKHYTAICQSIYSTIQTHPELVLVNL